MLFHQMYDAHTSKCTHLRSIRTLTCKYVYTQAYTGIQAHISIHLYTNILHVYVYKHIHMQTKLLTHIRYSLRASLH